MIEFTETTVTKVGNETTDEYQYSINAKTVNNELVEVSCNIYKKANTETNENVPGMVNSYPVGFIRFQNGRTATEIISDEDIVKHITKFSEIQLTVRSEMIITSKK